MSNFSGRQDEFQVTSSTETRGEDETLSHSSFSLKSKDATCSSLVICCLSRLFQRVS